MAGETGNDSFVFFAGNTGNDIITDFDQSEDNLLIFQDFAPGTGFVDVTLTVLITDDVFIQVTG